MDGRENVLYNSGKITFFPHLSKIIKLHLLHDNSYYKTNRCYFDWLYLQHSIYLIYYVHIIRSINYKLVSRYFILWNVLYNKTMLLFYIIITLPFIFRQLMNWLNLIWFIVLKATFSNISPISWRPVLVVEEAGENHRQWASNW